MTSTTNLLSPAWTTVRDQLRDRRQAHAVRKSLRRELAAYTSQSDLNDLDAILVRYSDTDTAAIRHILADHRG